MKKIIAITMGLFLGCSSFSQKKPEGKLKDNINEVFESYAHYNRFLGNVLISKNDKIIYKKSFGFADASTLRKNTKNTIFSVASVTKPLTAVGIMKLIEDDKLSLNTPISTFFPNFIPDYSPKITIRHLLNHSSGMQANIGRIDNEGNGLMPGENLVTLNNLFEKFKDSKLKHEPGKGFEYNNFGYTLLAYIIEDISKMSYAAYMEQAVFKPASMKNTSVNNYKVVRKKAFPHIGLGMHSFTKIRSKIHSSWLKGAGNINSTSLDLQRFMRALENGILLKPSSVEKLFNYTQSRGVNDSEYGLGWRIQNKDGEKWINHTGLLPGVTSIIGMLPEKNIKIVILTNATTTDLITESNFQGKNQFIDGEIIDKLITIIQGNKVELLPKSIKTKKIVDYSNKFKLDNKHSLVLKKQGDLYTLEATGKEPWSVFTYKFSKDANENNKTSETALFFANAMSSQNFDGLTTYGDKKMKEFLGSKEGINQLKGMWAYFLKNAGNFKSFNIYKINEISGNKTAHIRFHFEKEDVGFVLGINTENKIQGMFMDDKIRTSTIKKVKLTQTNKNSFFINGHRNNGMQDLKIKVSDKELILTDDKTDYKASIINFYIKNKTL